MSLLLAIETAGSNCSAALADGATVLASASRAMRHGHAEALMPIVDRVMREAGIAPRRLDHVAVAIGPGGFTGIRVGLAAAQGIARGAGASPIGITSFACIAVRVGAAAAGEGRALLVALDSRREDLYLQLFSGDGAVPLDGPQALLPGSLAAYIGSIVGRTPLLIAGDAAATAAAALEPHQVGAVRGELVPDALGVAAAARCQLAAGGVPEPLRPLYLRPPDVSLKPAPVPTAPVTLSIAPIAPAGAALVAALHGAAFPEDPWDAPAIAQVLLMPGAFGFVASLGDAPSGFVLACDLGREVEILALGTLPERRRQGVGRALMAAVAREAARRGCASLVLEVAEDNSVAGALYAGLGFAAVGRRSGYYRRADGRAADAMILRWRIADEPPGAGEPA